jgi:hypothetical protein
MGRVHGRRRRVKRRVVIRRPIASRPLEVRQLVEIRQMGRRRAAEQVALERTKFLSGGRLMRRLL